MRLTNGRITALAIGIPLALATAGWSGFTMVGQLARASEHHVASYPWRGGDISLHTSAGSVRVEAGTGTQVEVAYTEHYELRKPTITGATSNGGVQLNARCRAGIFDNNCEINYVLTVPASARLVLHTGDGGLEVSDVSGGASLDTGNGGIDLENVGGVIVARTGNGGISGTQLVSRVFQASTGNGGVHIEWAVGPTAVVVTTGNGGIHLVVPKGSGPYRASTHTGAGGVDVKVPTDIGASDSLTATTGIGGISIGLPAS